MPRACEFVCKNFFVRSHVIFVITTCSLTSTCLVLNCGDGCDDHHHFDRLSIGSKNAYPSISTLGDMSAAPQRLVQILILERVLMLQMQKTGTRLKWKYEIFHFHWHRDIPLKLQCERAFWIDTGRPRPCAQAAW